MPYTITVYSKWERRELHARGIWIDRHGNQLPVRSMSPERLLKLMCMLISWAKNDLGSSYDNIREMPIFPHVVMRILDLTGGQVYSQEARFFLDAYRHLDHIG